MSETVASKKQEIFDYVRYSLGDGIVDVEADPVHYEQGLKQALLRYRQRSSNSVEESYSFLTLETDVNVYTLPKEVISVRQLFRAAIGSTGSTSASNFEPFEAGFLNMYLLQAGRIGGLLNYELFTEYQELSARMFGGYLNFHFNKVSKQLQIMRRTRADGEHILLWTYNYKPDITLFNDYMALPWIRDYTLAYVKRTIGEAREKFGSIAGPQGGTTLNGASLKAEAQAEFERLEFEINNYMEGGSPLLWVQG